MSDIESKLCPKAFKAVLLGESTVGKTSIASVAYTGIFAEDQIPTVGASFQIINVDLGDTAVKINMWDTAGQERFRSLAPMFYRETDFAILVYSIENISSFQAIPEWYNNMQRDCTKMPVVLICANKSDLDNQRVVSTEEGFQLAQSLGCEFIELSAKKTPEK